MITFIRPIANQLSALALILTGLVSLGITCHSPLPAQNIGTDSSETKGSAESNFISSARQLTFEGKRAGEGYFSPDGSLLVFQSERRIDNPFFQIYLLDFDSGDVEPISPGYGKTTCAWVHPNNNLVLYASTQADPKAKAKQKEEIEFRESGQARRYSWDYDETYEIFSYDRNTKDYQQLTHELGYDAEGSYSPDGKLIAFASNRNGYSQPLTAEQKKKFETDPAYMMEIFIMNADGTNVRQLTDVPGYDGGPFFSPDGKRICWRRFSESGVTAEIMTMNIDGSDQKQLTNIGAMSWAPFYHPSGEYLIFTTNRHGFGNFELYLVAADGNSPPVRVTDTDGFDGLASFTPDGKQLTWTSTRNSKKESQIYLADWNHERASEALSANRTSENQWSPEEKSAFDTGLNAAQQASAGFDPRDIMRHVDYLCRKELGGRMTGSPGERKATAYVAAYLDHLGLKPAGENGTWFQKFDFPNGVKMGPKNQLKLAIEANSESLEVNKDWRPLSFSGNLQIDPTEIVFAGYGIVAPKQGSSEEYDSYVHLDVKDKWVFVYRFLPEDVSPERRRFFKKHAELHKKIFHARQQGAKGVIVVSGPNSQVREQLVPLRNDFSPSGSSIAAISVTDEVGQKILQAAGKDIQDLQNQLDDGSPVMGFNLTGSQLETEIDIEKITGKGRNVIGRLLAGDSPSKDAIIVGAHIDHLGAGKSGSSLAKQDEQNNIHFGADDNASGVAAMLEIAEYLVSQQRSGKLKLKRDVIFAGWSGEELGLYGSANYVKSLQPTQAPATQDSSHDFVLGVNSKGEILLNGETAKTDEMSESLKFISKHYPDFEIQVSAHPEAKPEVVNDLLKMVRSHGVQKVTLIKKDPQDDSSRPNTGIVAALNMDMVGRLTDQLVLQGVSSSSIWPSVIESKNAVVGLPVTLSNETDLPTDASSFYRGGIPILSAFTGSHTDYHTPRDTPEKLNYPDAARIARLMGLITRSLATTDEIPDYIEQSSAPQDAPKGGLRAYLGSVPAYGEDVVGVKLSDVTKGAPADTAGIQGGDIIVELAGKSIENIYDYTAIIDAIKIGEETTVTVLRNGKRVELKITPSSRQ
jgi:Tol biopolymer transport system component/Zn-dependent M28 family amino/carboxypeptidase